MLKVCPCHRVYYIDPFLRIHFPEDLPASRLCNVSSAKTFWIVLMALQHMGDAAGWDFNGLSRHTVPWVSGFSNLCGMKSGCLLFLQMVAIQTSYFSYDSLCHIYIYINMSLKQHGHFATNCFVFPLIRQMLQNMEKSTLNKWIVVNRKKCKRYLNSKPIMRRNYIHTFIYQRSFLAYQTFQISNFTSVYTQLTSLIMMMILHHDK